MGWGSLALSEISRPLMGHEKVAIELIKTLLIKIVHNKNHKVSDTPTGTRPKLKNSTPLAFKRPFIHLLTNRASFLQC
jgi:hypothetical protein